MAFKRKLFFKQVKSSADTSDRICKMSISQEYDSIIKKFTDEIEHTSLRQDSTEYQSILTSIIQRLVDLKTTVYTQLALFSENETIEDISTASLKFLSVDYYLALMCSRKQVISSQLNETMARNKMKLKFLEKALQLFMQFLISLQDFEILDPILVKKIDSLENTYKPTLKELYAQPAHSADLSAAQLKRQQKIDMFREKTQIDETLALIESKRKLPNESNDDDEQLRELYLQRLKSLSYEAFGTVEQILYETELLTNFTQNPEPLPSRQEQDTRTEDPTGYTDKLEMLNRPLLSREGKVLRNFTLIDKKTELQKKVRGYGQYGPTMSVEEFLEKEWEEGRVLQGGDDGQDQNNDDGEDDAQRQDKETYKAREWDEFKEANPRGSGNTMNRG